MGCGTSKNSVQSKELAAVVPVSPSAHSKGDDGHMILNSTFHFGDNTGCAVIGDDDVDCDPNAAENAALANNGHREAVSVEPIPPDEAEKFEPRVVPKAPAMFDAMMVAVKSNPLFRALDRDELSTVINAMVEEVFPEDTKVLRQGEKGNEKLYFITRGTVEILKANVGLVCTFTVGQVFGELELMYNSDCAATVRCATEVATYSLDRSTYRHIVMMVSIKRRRLYRELLGNVKFLKERMTPYESMALADALEPYTFNAGDFVVAFGGASEWMYIIVAGEVRVIGRREGTLEPFEVCTLGAGECIGELEFLNNHVAVADCIATGPLKTCRLHRDHFTMCMGPVKDYLREVSHSDKYRYYSGVTHEDESGKVTLEAFRFGDELENSPFGFTPTGSPEPGDGSVKSDDATKQPASRRIAVSDEPIAEDENWRPPVHEKSSEQMALLTSVLTKNPIFNSLEAKDFETVARAMVLREFPAHHNVLTAGGDGGEYYFVITSGMVEIIRNDVVVCTFSEGQGFGEMELLYIQPCVATVRTRVPTATWALDRQTYKRIVMGVAVSRRKLYSELLGNIDFLAQMTEYEKNTLADALTPRTYPPGSFLIRRGDRNEWMHIIIEGEVEVFGVSDETDESSRKHVCFLGPGSCVGELEFLNQHPAVADCVAKTELRTAMLHRDHFELCMGPVTDVLRRTTRQDKYQYYNEQLDLGTTTHRTTRRSRAKAVSAEVISAAEDDEWHPPVIEKSDEEMAVISATIRKNALFSVLQPSDRKAAIDAFEVFRAEDGHKFVEQGEVPEAPYWYVIASGSVSVLRDNAAVATLSAGQAFGDLELMYTTPSTSTIIAAEAVQTFRLDRRSYRKIIQRVMSERRALYRELLSGVPFLKQLDETQQSQLADALSPIHFRSGEYLVRKDTHNEWMFIIVDGVVEVFGRTGEKICDLRRGEMVGELEFLHNHAAVADCVAKTHVHACQLHRDHFETCMGPCTDYIKLTLQNPKYAYYNEQYRAVKEHRGDH